MKISFIGLDSNLTNIKKQDKIINSIKFNIFKIGEQASLISYFNNTFENLNNIIQDNYNLIFCIGSENALYNYNIKENFSRLFNKKIEKNFSCESALKKHCEINNLVFGSQEEMVCSLPQDSIPLCDSKYYDNGFMYRHNNTYIIYLPADYDLYLNVYSTLIMPMLKDIILTKNECVVLKCYGILEKDIRSIIENELSNKHVDIQIMSNRLDSSIHIRYNQENSDSVQTIIAEICSKLSKFIYSTEDSSLYETAINLLNIQKKKIVIAETITHGNTSLNISKNDVGVIEKSYIFNNFDSIASTLKLEPRVVNQFGKFSVNTVYELDNLLLQNSTSDIAVFILGDRSTDICYIAIGDIDGIHVYKNKIMTFNDSIIDTLTETTLFYLIKKLRQNDLQFR